MASGKSKRTILVIAAILIATAGPILLIRARDPLAAKVHAILMQDLVPARSKWKPGMDHLWALGPEVIPRLAAEARVRDTIWSRAYALIWPKLPRGMRRHLSPPVDRFALRHAAMHAIAEFGPMAARRAAPAVIAGLGETNAYEAITCLRWLLPDSAPAMAAFRTGLSGANTNWPPPHDFLGIGDGAIWSEIPGVVPLLTNQLGNARYAYAAAIALGRVGSNAAPAIPALIQTVDFGAAGSSTNARAAKGPASAGLHLSPGGWTIGTSLNHSQAMAALALGQIGVATTNVCAALARAWNSPDDWVRRNAAEAVALLGPLMTNELPELLRGLPDSDNAALDKKLLAMGKLGAGARAALNSLRDLSTPARLQSIVTNSESTAVGWDADDLSVSAKMAICRIDPQEGGAFLADLANRIGYWWEPVVCLRELGSLSNEVVRAVEPLLEQGENQEQSLAAYVILQHNKNHAKAQEVLRRNTAAGGLNSRLLAGQWLFEALGKTNGLCALISEGFASADSNTAQNAAALADKIGDAAKPALPAIKAALWHKDHSLREKAGELMIKLAPEQIPIYAP